MKTMIIIIATIILSGCASITTQMQNQATGDLKTCHTEGWGWFGTPAAVIMHGKCVRALESDGYIAVK